MMGISDSAYPEPGPPNYQQPSDELANAPTTPRHNGGDNQSYMDGHAKWISINSIPDVNPNAQSKNIADTAGLHYWFGSDTNWYNANTPPH
jgi:prepilin-type processing-associated H-X9-DG protein